MRCFDMLVKLYELPEVHIPDPKLAENNIRIFRPLPSDKKRITDYVRTHFSEVWANEFGKAMCNQPVSCFIAVKNGSELVGFSCYDASYTDFFGPIGVSDEYRGLHIGKELLLYSLYAMQESGYAYAIIGWSSEKIEPFYGRYAGAVEIPDSFPGIYRNALTYESM